MATSLPKTVHALWVAPFVGLTTDKTELVPRESVVEIGVHEAVQSDFWQPVEVIEPTAAEIREQLKAADVEVPARAKLEVLHELADVHGVQIASEVTPLEIDLGEEPAEAADNQPANEPVEPIDEPEQAEGPEGNDEGGDD